MSRDCHLNITVPRSFPAAVISSSFGCLRYVTSVCYRLLFQVALVAWDVSLCSISSAFQVMLIVWDTPLWFSADAFQIILTPADVPRCSPATDFEVALVVWYEPLWSSATAASLNQCTVNCPCALCCCNVALHSGNQTVWCNVNSPTRDGNSAPTGWIAAKWCSSSKLYCRYNKITLGYLASLTSPKQPFACFERSFVLYFLQWEGVFVWINNRVAMDIVCGGSFHRTENYFHCDSDT